MIEARGLSRRFGEFVAVDDLSLRVPDGTILALRLMENPAFKAQMDKARTELAAHT